MSNDKLNSLLLKIFLTLGICFICLFVLQLAAFAEQDYDGYIVKFKTPIVQTQTYSDNNNLDPIYPSENIYSISNETDDYITQLENDDNVEILEPNYIVSIPDMELDTTEFFSSDSGLLRSNRSFGFETPNDTFYASQWNLKMINAPVAWANNADTSSVKIGVIDSGNPSRHPDLNQNVVSGFDVTNTDPYDTVGHSTSVISIISANTNNNLGVAGILPKSIIIPLKAFLGKDTSYLNIINCMNVAINTYDCDVINLSIAAEFNSTTLENIIKKEIKNGRIFVASVGNKNDSYIMYPAGIDGVIGVGSVTQSKTRASHSQYNSSVDVVAPGLNTITAKMTISTTEYSYGYGNSSGTSFAAPHVTAAAAIAKYYKPDITANEFLDLLAETSEHLGDEGKNVQFGYGLLNIEALINALNPTTMPSNTPEPTETSNPSETSTPTETPTNQGIVVTNFVPTFDLDFSKAKANITLKNYGEDNICNVFLSSYSTIYDDETGQTLDILNGVYSRSNMTLLSNKSISFTSNTISIDNLKSSYLKLFVWDENMQPLTEPYVYELK